jgi:hypothetical protein
VRTRYQRNYALLTAKEINQGPIAGRPLQSKELKLIPAGRMDTQSLRLLSFQTYPAVLFALLLTAWKKMDAKLITTSLDQVLHLRLLREMIAHFSELRIKTQKRLLGHYPCRQNLQSNLAVTSYVKSLRMLASLNAALAKSLSLRQQFRSPSD